MAYSKHTFGTFKILALLALVVLGFLSPTFAAEDPSAEWTLEQARKCWKPMTRAVQHVGVPGYEFQTGVMWDGALVFGPLGFRELKVMQQEIAPLGNHYLHVSFGYGEPMRLVDRQGTNSPSIRRSIEGGRLPIPSIETRDGDLAWTETVFAHLLDRPADQWLDAKTGRHACDPRGLSRQEHRICQTHRASLDALRRHRPGAIRLQVPAIAGDRQGDSLQVRSALRPAGRRRSLRDSQAERRRVGLSRRKSRACKASAGRPRM